MNHIRHPQSYAVPVAVLANTADIDTLEFWRRIPRVVLAVNAAVDNFSVHPRAAEILADLREPIDRQLVVGIGELGAGPSGDRALAGTGVGFPGDCGYSPDLHAERVEGRISELPAVALIPNSGSSSFGLGMPLRGFGRLRAGDDPPGCVGHIEPLRRLPVPP